MARFATVEQLLHRVETTWRNYELAVEHDLSQATLDRLLATHTTAMYAYLAEQTWEAQAAQAQQMMTAAQAIPAPHPSPVVQSSLFGDHR